MENVMIGPKGIIKKNELVRFMIQCLHSLGYMKSAVCLESESGVPLKNVDFELLESEIRSGKWDESFGSITKIKYMSDEMRDSALFLVLEQCLMECLSSGNGALALDALRKRVSELRLGEEKVRSLALRLLSPRDSGFNGNDDGIIQESREKLIAELEGLLPPPLTVPEKRLEQLVERAVVAQIDKCLYHTSSSISLYEDHKCSRDHFPTKTVQILSDHMNEVWFVQFSNNGEYLASSSSDCTAIIWKVLDNGQVAQKHILKSHKNPVSFVSWSPDDTMLLTCGNLEVLKLWDVETGTCKHTYGSDGFIVTSCAWFPDSRRLVCGSSDPEKGIYMWDSDGNEIKAWKGVRMPKVTDIAITPDGEHLISIFSDKEIRILNLESNAERVISADHSITSLSISGDSKFFIVNLNSQEIHMWDVLGKWQKPRKYKGHRQHKYVIRSCFGGLNSTFIASGSEDSKVYLWNRQSYSPIEVLSGHVKTVNCVSWNLRRPQMLASASDDQTIRIWGPEEPCK